MWPFKCARKLPVDDDTESPSYRIVWDGESEGYMIQRTGIGYWTKWWPVSFHSTLPEAKAKLDRIKSHRFEVVVDETAPQ